MIYGRKFDQGVFSDKLCAGEGGGNNPKWLDEFDGEDTNDDACCDSERDVGWIGNLERIN